MLVAPRARARTLVPVMGWARSQPKARWPALCSSLEGGSGSQQASRQEGQPAQAWGSADTLRAANDAPPAQ
jgi:hypothetical protein